MSTLPPPTAVVVDLEAPLEVARWRPLVHWFLAIPHFVVLYVLSIAASFVMLAGFVAVLVTKNVPEGLHAFLARYYRYQWRVATYSLWMREPYPGFGLPGDAHDPGDDPARLAIPHAPELNRWAPLYKWILAIPHYLVLVVLALGALVVIVVAFFATLFTGAWPEGMRRYVVGVARWQNRVTAYLLLRDEYPPFALD